MLTLRVKAIVPKSGSVIDVRRVSSGITRELAGFATDVVKEMTVYPAQRSGSSYVRSGDYGRNWTITPKPPGEVLVENKVRSNSSARRSKSGRKRRSTGRGKGRAYAVYVGGPKYGSPEDHGAGTRQAEVNAKAGWKNITDVSNRAFRKRRTRIELILRGRSS